MADLAPLAHRRRSGARRASNVMKSCWQRPAATAEVMEDGCTTGDLARRDEDGLGSIVDRERFMTIRGGHNVHPREIEEVLYEHPAVREVAVIGVADEALGEEVAAAVVAKEGQSIDELPKDPTGKILEREITVPEVAR